jgi:nucleoid DNA-binding protein
MTAGFFGIFGVFSSNEEDSRGGKNRNTGERHQNSKKHVGLIVYLDHPKNT